MLRSITAEQRADTNNLHDLQWKGCVYLFANWLRQTCLLTDTSFPLQPQAWSGWWKKNIYIILQEKVHGTSNIYIYMYIHNFCNCYYLPTTVMLGGTWWKFYFICNFNMSTSIYQRWPQNSRAVVHWNSLQESGTLVLKIRAKHQNNGTGRGSHLNTLCKVATIVTGIQD